MLLIFLPKPFSLCLAVDEMLTEAISLKGGSVAERRGEMSGGTCLLSECPPFTVCPRQLGRCCENGHQELNIEFYVLVVVRRNFLHLGFNLS